MKNRSLNSMGRSYMWLRYCGQVTGTARRPLFQALSIRLRPLDPLLMIRLDGNWVKINEK